MHLAIIEPTFTTTAYLNNAFYSFYASPSNSSTWALNVTVVNAWGYDAVFLWELQQNVLKQCSIHLSVVLDSTLAVIGYDSIRNYSVVILPFEEYTTLSEYNALKTFVSNGGELISLNGDSLMVLINYSASTNTIQLWHGHGWNYSGGVAYRYNVNPLNASNVNWLGSTFCCFHVGGYSDTVVDGNTSISQELRTEFGETIWQYYPPSEDAAILNTTNTQMIGRSVENSGPYVVGPYMHEYQKGLVISSSICLDNLIASTSETSAEAFLVFAILAS